MCACVRQQQGKWGMGKQHCMDPNLGKLDMLACE